MNTRKRSGFGIADTRHQVARRYQSVREREEYVDHRLHRGLHEAELPDPATLPKEKRPLAA